jgi:hypothetical protein
LVSVIIFDPSLGKHVGAQLNFLTKWLQQIS